MKRWYQLSMLQTLFALAVVALFVVKNLSVRKLNDEHFFLYAEREYGWPFTHYTSGGYANESGFVIQEFHRWNLLVMLNAACCLVGCIVAVSLVPLVTRKIKQ